MSQESVSTQVHGNEERRTVSEKIVALTHLPYAAGCIVIGVLVGYPGFFLMSFLETMDLQKAARESLTNPFFLYNEIRTGSLSGSGDG